MAILALAGVASRTEDVQSRIWSHHSGSVVRGTLGGLALGSLGGLALGGLGGLRLELLVGQVVLDADLGLGLGELGLEVLGRRGGA